MAICKMKKLSAVVRREDYDGFLRDLQKMRCVDIVRYGKFGSSDIPDGMFTAITDQQNELRGRIRDASSAEAFLARYVTKSKSLFKAKPEVTLDSCGGEFAEMTGGYVKQANGYEEQLNTVRARTDALKGEMDALMPFESIGHRLPHIMTRSCKAMCGSMPSSAAMETVDSELEELACVFEVISSDEKASYVRLVGYGDDYAKAMTVLTSYGFTQCPVSVGRKDGYAKGRIETIREELKQLLGEEDELEEKSTALTEHYEDIKKYIDYLSTELRRCEVSSNLAHSGKCSMVSGWIADEDEARVTAYLESSPVAYSIEDTADDDPDAPIRFRNNKVARQFEPVVELYAPPAYGSYDPTFIMSIFYFVIFGLMLADVGYGLLLSLGCFAMIRLMNPQGNTRKMLTMFGICGISCMIMGVLFGGYFSDTPSVLAKNWFGAAEDLDLAVWFNPLTNPIPFLGVSLGVGAVHLITALCIKFYILWTRGKKFDAIADQGSWIILFVGIIVALLARIPGLIMVGIGVLMLILTQGRSQKNVFMKFFKGVASLYDIVSYFSDLLSYSRILALGLASMVVGSVFNILGTLPGLNFIGVIMFIVIFLLGHTLNLAVNLLGTFVHTSRLQYIEFFGKFYEDGGRMFEPLAPESKNVIFK